MKTKWFNRFLAIVHIPLWAITSNISFANFLSQILGIIIGSCVGAFLAIKVLPIYGPFQENASLGVSLTVNLFFILSPLFIILDHFSII